MQTKNFKTLGMLLISLVLLGLLVSGCGSDDGDEDKSGLEGVSSANITHTPVPTLTPTNEADSPSDDVLSNLIPITLENITQLQVLQTLRSPSGLAGEIILSPDETQLVVSGVNDIQVWSLETFELVRTISSVNETIGDISLHPNGIYVVAIGDGGILEAWNIETGEVLDFVESTALQPTALNFSPDGQYLAIGYQGGITELRHFDTNEVVMQVAWQRGVQQVASAEFTQDGNYLVTSHPDGSFLLWDVATGERVNRFIGHSSRLNMVIFSPDGAWLASTGQDNDIRIWNTTTFEQRHQLRLDYDGNQLAFDPTGRILASTGQSGRVRFWDLEHGEELYRVDGEVIDGTVWTTGVMFSQAGDFVVFGYADEIIFLGIPHSSGE